MDANYKVRDTATSACNAKPLPAIYLLQPRPIASVAATAMLFAILLPGISMIFRGHVLKGILCGVLHLTLIGWIPAAIWAVASYQRDLADERHRETMELLTRQGRR